MANNGRLDVYFHNGTGNVVKTETDLPTQQTAPVEQATIPQQNSDSISKSMIYSTAISASKNLMLYGASIVGDVTGRQNLQSSIDMALQAAAMGAMIANFPVGTTMAAVQLTTTLISSGIKTRNENRNAELLRIRMGNETFNNSEYDI